VDAIAAEEVNGSVEQSKQFVEFNGELVLSLRQMALWRRQNSHGACLRLQHRPTVATQTSYQGGKKRRDNFLPSSPNLLNVGKFFVG